MVRSVSHRIAVRRARRARAFAALAVAAGAAAGLPATALAGSGTISGGVLTYTATAGQINSIIVSRGGADVRISDSGGVTGSGSCSVVSSTVLDCGPESALTSVTANAGDMDDVLAVNGTNSAGLPIALNGDGGTDTVSFSAVPNGVHVDLGSGTATGAGTVQLSGIENVIGSPFADDVSGDGNANVLDGGGGNDTADYSTDGAVTINLASGHVTGAGGDTLTHIENAIGSPANDTFVGDGADNAFDGGGGIDTVDYSGATTGVTVNLALGKATGQGTDTLTHIENVTGSPQNDLIYPSTDNNTINGNGGSDIVDYAASPAAVKVDLGAGTGTGTATGTDLLSSIEGAIGTSSNDTFAGDALNNSFDGGPGSDTIDESGSGSPVTVSLATGTASSLSGGTDTLASIENVIGSAQDDALTGSSADNTIDGRAGNDTIDGLGGTDVLLGGAGNDTVHSADGVADVVDCGADTDTVAADPMDTLTGCETVDQIAAVTGPQGPPGQTGAQGIQGPPGQQGAPGATAKLVVVAYQATIGRSGVTVRYALTAPASLTLAVKPPRGATVTVAHTTGRVGVGRITWNRRLHGRRAPRGRYRLALTAAAGGSQATSTISVTLR